MKNLHVLPTDKPSRLRIGDNRNFVFGLVQSAIVSKNDSFTNQHIYITSDEEIKEGVNQWYLDKFLNKPRNSSGSQYGEKQDVIILTTDQSLDGVQAIDDEFLEWFVKNQSCEKAEVEGNIYKGQDETEYKIIIPKEERERGITITHVGKQETFEEVAERFVKNRFTKQICNDESYPDIYASKEAIVESHILFAKCQQEISYSEEELLNLLTHFAVEIQRQNKKGQYPIEIKGWFERNKDKFKNR